ncbi:MAG: glutamate mutase L [Aggregatilineales bacterium]
MAAEPGGVPTPIHSILAADFGSVHTRLVLIDQVTGQYRLVSYAQTLTTAVPPFGNVTIGMERAVEQLSSQTGRVFEGRGGDLLIGERTDGAGVNQFIATASGGRPMRTVLVGLTPDVSLESGRRALGSIYAELTDTLSLADLRTQEEQVNAILNNRPDLIFIVGGMDGGAREAMLALLHTVKLAVSLLVPDRRPVIVYAGNEALHSDVTALLGDEAPVQLTSNVRPRLTEERLGNAQLELAVAYGAYKSSSTSVGNFAEVKRLSPLGVLPTATSYSTVIRYLGELPGSGAGVLCVDVGSSTVTVCASIRKQVSIAIHPELGLGHSAVSSVGQVSAPSVLRWLSYDSNETDLANYAWNKTLRPSTVPQTPEELEMEYALTREIIRYAVQAARQGWPASAGARGDRLPSFRPIIGAGAVLTQGTVPGVAAMLLLDGVQPVGVTELKLDPYGTIPALGGIAYVQPLAMVQVLESGGLLDLGTAICPDGRTAGDEPIGVTVKYASGRTIKRTVNGLQVIDLPAGQKATVTLQLPRGLTLNGRGRGVTLTVTGGAAGIIIDGRGRPLPLSGDAARRKALLLRWMASARGDELSANNGASLPPEVQARRDRAR